MSVNYAVTGGTASSGSDYTLPPGTLTFAAGETAKILPSTIIDDDVLEPNETLIVTLSSPVDATLARTTVHTYTITDDDATTVSVAATVANATEGGAGGVFTLTRSGSANSACP